jgi:hypothetical protein
MDGVSSTEAVEVLHASLAAEPAAESDVDDSDADEEPGRILGMSPAVQGMILLNISAALFGSNQVNCRIALLTCLLEAHTKSLVQWEHCITPESGVPHTVLYGLMASALVWHPRHLAPASISACAAALAEQCLLPMKAFHRRKAEP